MSETIAHDRRRSMLRTAMGPTIAAALADPLVLEIMVNPDGALRLDRLGEGRIETQVSFEAAQVERIIRLVASQAKTEVHAASPIVSPAPAARMKWASHPWSELPCWCGP